MTLTASMMSLRSMAAARAATISAARSLSQKKPQRGATHVLLLHDGWPRSEFYARAALSAEARAFYNLPDKLPFDLPQWLIPKKVSECMEEYGKHGDVQETVMEPLTNALGDTVLRIMPELESVNVTAASPFEAPTIEHAVRGILDSGAGRLVIMPLQPHFGCSRSGLLINEAARALSSLSAPSHESPTARIVHGTATSTELSTLERWSTHPVMSNLWSSRLEAARSSIDAVLFVAPVLRGFGRRDYERSVYASAERTISETRVPLPWRVAFFNGWNQWDLPVVEGIGSGLRQLKEKRVAVVPITSIVPSFDTISILPKALVGRPHVELLKPEVNSILIQGMAEALRNHLLGRRSGQLQLRCTGCFRNDCQRTRELLA